MLIACLGWGSLVWDPRELPVRGTWFADGPFLPIEFGRRSSDGRITLVLAAKTFPLVRTLWQPMSAANLKEARKALGLRECHGSSKPDSCVDFWPKGSKNKLAARHVGRWAKSLHIDAVVWTNLPPRFNGVEKRMPTAGEVVTYLRGLQGEKRERAEEYIRKAPRQIDTEYRRAIERELGWIPVGPI
jgi:hypothetical protein